MTKESLTLTKDLAWPWSLPYGTWALAAVALLLVGLTVWTYAGSGRVGLRRMAVVLFLRLLALGLACVMILRPSLAYRDTSFPPSILLIGLDRSESMTNRDEPGNRSRWEALQHYLKEADPELKRLQDEQNLTVAFYHFAEDARAFDADAKPDGKRSDYGQSLQSLFQTHQRDRNLRGLLLLGDGADNGTRFPALAEAARFRTIACPIYTFGLGQQTTSDRQRDIVFTAIHPDPPVVPVKGKLTVRGTLDAFGFENSTVVVRLFVNDKEVVASKETLRRTIGNEVSLTADAPAKAGEIKVTLKAEPLSNEVSSANNEISTYVTVTQEGVNVLVVDTLRLERSVMIQALKTNPRIRVFEAVILGDEPAADMADLFQFDRQAYDVIILGDVLARQLTAGDPDALRRIHDLVRDKGTGLLMTGRNKPFGDSDWRGTPVEACLPVELDSRDDFAGPLRMEPTKKGLAHYVLRLADDPAANQALWNELPTLTGFTRLGKEKPNASVLATRAGTEEPLLAFQQYGDGRTLAFAADTTWHWTRLGLPKSDRGIKAHARFWNRLVLFLAKQDEMEGTVWIKPDARRVPAGGKVPFSVGLSGKGGSDLPGGHFEITAVDPRGGSAAVESSQDQGIERGIFWKTDVPGEYLLKVHGKGKDHDGKEISGEASAHVLVYQDDAEMMRRAADHDLLTKLAQASGGKFYRAHDLKGFIQSELAQAPQAQAAPKTTLYPDWRRRSLSGLQPGVLLAFVCLLGLEWFLRRTWGMV